MVFCYLLESTELCGGVRVVFDQARLLLKRGHQVVIRAKQGSHSWYHHPIDIVYFDDLAAPFSGVARPDVVIATFWTTVKSALALDCPKTFHFCQGYEGDIIEYADIKQNIEDIYRLPIVKLTVGKWLTTRLQEIFGQSCFPVHTIGQIIDTQLFVPPPFPFARLWRQFAKRSAKILLMGMFESKVKGIPDALHAIRLLKQQGVKLRVTRVSSNALTEDEQKITTIDHYLSNVPPGAIASLYHTHDIMLSPSLSQEGFGLPFAEALASGLPCIATAIPSHSSFDSMHDYAVFVPPSDPEAMAQAIIALLNDPKQQSYLRQRGPQLVRQIFPEASVAEQLETVCSN